MRAKISSNSWSLKEGVVLGLQDIDVDDVQRDAVGELDNEEGFIRRRFGEPEDLRDERGRFFLVANVHQRVVKVHGHKVYLSQAGG